MDGPLPDRPHPTRPEAHIGQQTRAHSHADKHKHEHTHMNEDNEMDKGKDKGENKGTHEPSREGVNQPNTPNLTPSTTSMLTLDDPVRRRGWLRKLGGKIIRKWWQDRYFCVHVHPQGDGVRGREERVGGGVLQYFKDSEQVSVCVRNSNSFPFLLISFYFPPLRVLPWPARLSFHYMYSPPECQNSLYR